jgi:hypothetical protein
MPQLDFVSYFPQIVWVLFLFVLLFVSTTQGLLPALRRIFWFREFKKLGFVSDSGIVSNFTLRLFRSRSQLVGVASFCSVVVPYFIGGVGKSTFIIKRIWLVYMLTLFFSSNYDKTCF